MDVFKNVNKQESMRKLACKKIEKFHELLNLKENCLDTPRGEINTFTNDSISRVNAYLSDYVVYLNKFKDHVVAFIESYKENAYSKLESLSHHEFENLKKLTFKCKEAYNSWMEILGDENNNVEVDELAKILLDICKLKTELYEAYDNAIFNTQRLYSCESKFYRLVDEYTIFYENEAVENELHQDKFYLDMNRLSHVKTGKAMLVGETSTLGCKLFSTYGGRFIAVWIERGVCRLQLIDINENGETMLPICTITITNSISDSAMIAASERGDVIAIVFSIDMKTYWVKTFDCNLKEVGLRSVIYRPKEVYVNEKFIFIIDNSDDRNAHVYDTNLNVVGGKKSRENELIVYYLKKFGDQICFRNDYIFVPNDSDSETLSIINRDTEDVLCTLKCSKIKLFKIDTLMRVVVYSEEEMPKLSIYDLDGNQLKEFELKAPLISFCVTDDGYLIATTGFNGELIIF